MTLRQLVPMARARREHEWSIASNLMALTANIHRGPRRAPFRAARFNPTIAPEPEAPTLSFADTLAALFPGRT